MIIAEKLRFYRKQKKLTLIQLGKKTGISFSTIAKIERGEINPKFSTVLTLCKHLNISIEDLIK